MKRYVLRQHMLTPSRQILADLGMFFQCIAFHKQYGINVVSSRVWYVREQTGFGSGSVDPRSQTTMLEFPRFLDVLRSIILFPRKMSVADVTARECRYHSWRVAAGTSVLVDLSQLSRMPICTCMRGYRARRQVMRPWSRGATSESRLSPNIPCPTTDVMLHRAKLTRRKAILSCHREFGHSGVLVEQIGKDWCGLSSMWTNCGADCRVVRGADRVRMIGVNLCVSVFIDVWIGARIGWGKREIAKETRRPATSFGTIPTCENPRAAWHGIEPGWRWWEADSLTTQPPRPRLTVLWRASSAPAKQPGVRACVARLNLPARGLGLGGGKQRCWRAERRSRPPAAQCGSRSQPGGAYSHAWYVTRRARGSRGPQHQLDGGGMKEPGGGRHRHAVREAERRLAAILRTARKLSVRPADVARLTAARKLREAAGGGSAGAGRCYRWWRRSRRSPCCCCSCARPSPRRPPASRTHDSCSCSVCRRRTLIPHGPDTRWPVEPDLHPVPPASRLHWLVLSHLPSHTSFNTTTVPHIFHADNGMVLYHRPWQILFPLLSFRTTGSISDDLDIEETGVEIGGWGKREIPEKTRRPAAPSGTIPTCENPVTRPGIEPGSPWWEAIVLIAQSPCPPPPSWKKVLDDVAELPHSSCSWHYHKHRLRRVGVNDTHCTGSRLNNYSERSPVHCGICVRIGVGQCWVRAQKRNKRSTSSLVYGPVHCGVARRSDASREQVLVASRTSRVRSYFRGIAPRVFARGARSGRPVFAGDLPFPPAHAFRRRSTLALVSPSPTPNHHGELNPSLAPSHRLPNLLFRATSFPRRPDIEILISSKVFALGEGPFHKQNPLNSARCRSRPHSVSTIRPWVIAAIEYIAVVSILLTPPKVTTIWVGNHHLGRHHLSTILAANDHDLDPMIFSDLENKTKKLQKNT
ncbi:hypothetical protein PR048_009754 [Dryococelus australis]|uniref:Uncharacterized protein n=1 Tax=Dryococelus australis TaxID=614101 RepID=A0ABQ9I0T7_9NEOP|nr:hypothetical protein PR048_009754 [Dryococelus australis]